MATPHRRIGVIRDPELDRALIEVGDRLRAGSAAGRIRELALIGARALAAEGGVDSPATMHAVLDARGVLPAARPPSALRVIGLPAASANETEEVLADLRRDR